MPPDSQEVDNVIAVTRSTQPAFAEERRQRILAVVASQGRVRNAELVALLGVTEPTIRKDLSVLEKLRLLRRTHGGAIAIQPQYEPTIDDRNLQFGEAKQLIAEACLAEIGEGDFIFLDTGTTVHRIAELLGQRQVSVLTNSPDVAATVADKPTIRHTLTGGQLRLLGRSLVGPIALDTLTRFTVNTAFIGVSGLTVEGISVSDVGEAQMKQAVIDRARKVVVAMHSAKFGLTDFVNVCGLDRIDLVVTEHATAEIRHLCAEHQIELRIAGAAPSTHPS